MSNASSSRARTPIVAIDGPAGAGKSTVAKLVARSLEFTLLDTGALYRAVALAAKRSSVPWSDGEACGRFAHALVARKGLGIEALPGSGMRVLLDGVDVGDAIRTPEMSMGASTVSAIPAVREALLDLQRSLARGGVGAANAPRGLVCEGRDIGTVVFPDAEAKLFVTASVDARAKRRHLELEAKGTSPLPSLEQTRAEVAERDRQDETRAIAPLRKADDAILVDTTELSIEQAVYAVLTVVRRRVAGVA